MNADYLNSTISAMQGKIEASYQKINAHIDKTIASESITEKKEVCEWENYVLKELEKIKTCLELTSLIMSSEREALNDND